MFSLIVCVDSWAISKACEWRKKKRFFWEHYNNVFRSPSMKSENLGKISFLLLVQNNKYFLWEKCHTFFVLLTQDDLFSKQTRQFSERQTNSWWPNFFHTISSPYELWRIKIIFSFFIYWESIWKRVHWDSKTTCTRSFKCKFIILFFHLFCTFVDNLFATGTKLKPFFLIFQWHTLSFFLWVCRLRNNTHYFPII